MKILSFQEYFRQGLFLDQYNTVNSQRLISIIHILTLFIILQYTCTCIHLICVCITCIFSKYTINCSYNHRFSTKFLLLLTTGSIMYNSPQIRPQNLYSIIAEITSLLNVDPSPRAYIWCGF